MIEVWSMHKGFGPFFIRQVTGKGRMKYPLVEFLNCDPDFGFSMVFWSTVPSLASSFDTEQEAHTKLMALLLTEQVPR